MTRHRHASRVPRVEGTDVGDPHLARLRGSRDCLTNFPLEGDDDEGYVLELPAPIVGGCGHQMRRVHCGRRVLRGATALSLEPRVEVAVLRVVLPRPRRDQPPSGLREIGVCAGAVLVRRLCLARDSAQISGLGLEPHAIAECANFLRAARDLAR